MSVENVSSSKFRYGKVITMHYLNTFVLLLSTVLVNAAPIAQDACTTKAQRRAWYEQELHLYPFTHLAHLSQAYILKRGETGIP